MHYYDLKPGSKLRAGEFMCLWLGVAGIELSRISSYLPCMCKYCVLCRAAVLCKRVI